MNPALPLPPFQSRASLFFEPRRYRPHGVGYWSGHIPFACDLVYSLRPRTLVELGTHTGESYFAFCQAVEESGIDCQTFAVDTWRGDQHTGAYSERVFDEVTAWNATYSRFSTLLRRTFDDAAPEFADETIDLLHIDGAHTYEAIQHDFELWWPKMRGGGVVVMHDSHERGHNFGVWRWLEELRTRFPAEEFIHSHGLAVIVKPPVQPNANVASEFVSAGGDELKAIRRYYEMCASGQRQRYLTERRRSDEWDVLAQLFWRSEGQAFTEASSVRTAEIVVANGETLLLPIAPGEKPYVELRVVPSLEAAMLTVVECWIDDLNKQRIWGESAATSLAAWQEHGLQASEGAAGAVVFNRTGTNAFTIPLPSAVSNSLSRGGQFYLRLLGMDSFAYAAELTAVQTRAHPAPPKKPSRLARLFART